MSEFYVSLSEEEMAFQIANMLNAYNKLYVKHTTASIRNGVSKYFVEITSPSQVIGCAGLTKEYPVLSRIHHICIHPNHRKKGIAKKLINIAMSNCDTEYVYMTIREDNKPSIAMAFSMGFIYVNKAWSRNHDHFVITVGRRSKI